MKMVKVLILNKRGKIEITKEELEGLLNESYLDGYWVGKKDCWVYESPNPIKITCDSPYGVQDTPFTINTTSSNLNNKEDKNNV